MKTWIFPVLRADGTRAYVSLKALTKFCAQRAYEDAYEVDPEIITCKRDGEPVEMHEWLQQQGAVHG